MAQKKSPFVNTALKLNDDLYALVEAEAAKRDLHLCDVMIERIALSFERPDLNFIPRKRIGRPPRHATSKR